MHRVQRQERIQTSNTNAISVVVSKTGPKHDGGSLTLRKKTVSILSIIYHLKVQRIVKTPECYRNMIGCRL